ncbi:BTAD domain-containing putative transcriptional regulator [Amycolatopsis sp. FDAARGOS 1241]|uniref:BTAD domain-containing putative transcriptional regulator n=1 Tax=Amycolatopsis sp. FDAARGOS 1241 TaxID=2778070 RepID=UPI001951C87C|nr:BTAD domain-containing putative transcriptional regulator [Amycolatopsis sp. FDAARGOS 1241]QRP42764.1 AAA family ATPase [Amycolatopsis sp. FDAARGOS 1241]
MSLSRQQQTQPNSRLDPPGERSSPQVSIQLLGRFAVRQGDREQPDRAFGGRLARQLLRMLAVSRGTLVSKDAAIAALWPADPPVDAGGNVEILISRIRRALGDRSLIQTGSGGYTLVGDDRCRVDVEAFLTAVGRGQAELHHDPGTALSAFRAALAMWHGEPLAEDAYAAWAVEHRHHLLRAHLDALEGAAAAALAVGDSVAALAWAQTAADEHPLRETAALLLVRALAAGGDRAAALASFDAFGRRLGDELGIDPSAVAMRLRQQVLCDEIGPVLAAGSQPLTIPGFAADGNRLVSSTPFVGRNRVLARIAGLLADREVRVVLVRGSPGSGKSRLLQELADHVAMPVVVVRADRDRQDDSGAVAADLLRALQTHEAPAEPGKHRHSIPAPRPQTPSDGTPRDTDSPTAEGAVLRAIRQRARPHCLIAIDDLQWADDSSLILLRVLRQRVPGLQVIATYPATRPSGRPDPVAVLAGVDSGLARRVDLAPWSDTDLAVIADPVLRGIIAECTDRTPATVLWVLDALAAQHLIERDSCGRWRLHDQSSRSRVRALTAGGGPLVRAAVASLPAASREALTLLALIGRPTPPSVLATAAREDLPVALDALTTLAEAGLVQGNHDGWAPATSTIGEVAVADLDPAGRLWRHLMLAEALRELGADVAEVATHLAAGGDGPAAALAFADAARVRLNRIADGEALSLTEAGLGASAPGQTRSALWRIRGEAHRRQGRLGDARGDLDAALAEAPSEADRSRVLAQRALLETPSFSAFLGAQLAGLAIAEAGDDPAARGQALAARALVDLWLARLDRARQRFRQAQRLLRLAGDPDGAARLLHWPAMAALLAGRLTEAAARLDDLAQLPATTPETLLLWHPRASHGHTLVLLGDPAAGLAEIDTALTWSRAANLAEMHSSCLWHRSEALSALGRHEEAVDAARAALAIARRIEHTAWTAASLRALGTAWQTAGDLTRAEAAFRDSLHAGRPIPLFAGWAQARLGLVLVGQGRLGEAEPVIGTALRQGAPLARHEARWAQAELLHARGAPTASAAARAALAAAGEAGYEALVPRLAALAG